MCVCGKVYYNPDNGWTWDEGEIEELEKSGAISSEYSIGYTEFEGRSYVDVCPCRNERVEQLLNFIDGHSTQIAEYLNREADSAMAKAKSIRVKNE